MTAILCFCLAAIATLLLVNNHYEEKWNRELREDFERLFPGDCFVCSYWRWLNQQTGESDPVPKHQCHNRSKRS